ncbi:hypothetical protein EJ05DRAFT_498792 [Pseudovirgaria hyperparasitica]|uniref:Uncharacterized protein n=1 Tax=Pseudovirgaria hyperparasitica TaxID=470096 RepID=A0A6A6WC92_9PEZI|nr:uncharacterized protein EJ05DRAFT_498792 [Pseudovirgaria hyperparasitica]KAF2759580.1 hypothetical protein EJ05DRAFT_498792 [Pseudovirgaria hyperparasitica]
MSEKHLQNNAPIGGRTLSSSQYVSRAHLPLFRATGRLGRHFVTTFLITNKYTVTTLTRTRSPKYQNHPSRVQIREVNYANHTSLTSQHALITTLLPPLRHRLHPICAHHHRRRPHTLHLPQRKYEILARAGLLMLQRKIGALRH